MKTIYKYPLEMVDEQKFKINLDYIIAVKEQNGGLAMWAVVDPTLTEKEITIKIVGTGNPFPDSDDCLHLETVVMSYGNFVWHVFEKLEEKV